MLAVMFWPNEEEKRKARVEEKLRKKKEERRGEKIKPPTLPDNASITSNDSEELARQTALINSQQEELVSLKHLLVQQGKLLQQILEKQEQPVKEVIIQPTTREIRDEKDDLPSLNENISTDVIDKSGIEISGGSLGGNQSEGQSNVDRIRRLKELKKRRSE